MNVCIPTLNAVDEFNKCVKSIEASSIKCNIWVVDNGGYVDSLSENMKVHKPAFNLGVAGSWNWFLDNVPYPKIITNDDVIFDEMAVESMLRAQDSTNLVIPENIGESFSCFLIPEEIVNKVGRFDEWISPRYAYFEDNDYSYRMSLLGFGIKRAQFAMVQHAGSSTIKHFPKQKMKEHHDKFRLARDHYKKKWGGEPGAEQFSTPFNQ